MRVQKVLEGMIPAVFFVYLIGVYMMGGISLLASTLPFFTMFFAVFGSIVFSQASVQKADNSRARDRKQR